METLQDQLLKKLQDINDAVDRARRKKLEKRTRYDEEIKKHRRIVEDLEKERHNICLAHEQSIGLIEDCQNQIEAELEKQSELYAKNGKQSEEAIERGELAKSLREQLHDLQEHFQSKQQQYKDYFGVQVRNTSGEQLTIFLEQQGGAPLRVLCRKSHGGKLFGMSVEDVHPRVQGFDRLIDLHNQEKLELAALIAVYRTLCAKS